jgi:spore photoproduct lyase
LRITDIYIDQAVSGYPVARRICNRLNLPFTVVNDLKGVYERILCAKDPVSRGKKTLLLTQNRGAFVRDCPGTRYYTCCNYKILHIGTFCSMDCAYCILQSYFHPPLLQFFVNHQGMFEALDGFFLQKETIRIGTGEFTDSLIWEEIYPFSGELVLRFAAQASAVLELKTKTTNIENLLPLDHNRKTIMAWSLNTERVIREEERMTTGLTARLKAAAACEAAGYPLAFHFDPLIIYPGCAAEYRSVIKALFRHVSPENIVWISLGSFRFMPALKPVIESRFSSSKITLGEFIKGIDGKMRYFKPLRIDFYREIVSCIRSIAPKVVLYFCMEDDEVWQKGLGFLPFEYGGLPNLLDQSAIAHCGLTDHLPDNLD